MKKLLSLTLALAMTLSLVACGSSTEQETQSTESENQETMTIKFATVGPDSGTAQAEAEALLMKHIEEASNGKIKVEYFPNSALGGDLDLAEGLANGSIQMASVGNSVLTSYSPKIGIFDIPFLFTDAEAAIKAASEGELGKMIAKELEGTGILCAKYWAFGGYRGLSNSVRPITSPADMEGLKIRVQESPVYITSFTLLGANPTPISFSELFTALQNNTVVGQDNDPSLTYTSKFYEVQKYYTDLQHITTLSCVKLSESWYNSLSDEYTAFKI